MIDNEIAEFAEDQNRQLEYVKWRALPMTQFVMKTVLALHRPVMPITSDMNVMATCHAVQCGITQCVKDAFELDTILKGGEMPEADYGSEQYMEQWGRKPRKEGK
jgi:hypothetical protein